MPGTLHVVATPIGNLEDVTLRALSVLRSVAVIAAEDTRRTQKLLSRFQIATPTLSYHEHNSRRRLPQLVERLRSGDDVALVTDAGTPGISDPGAELVLACVNHDIPVNPVPGVSAPLAAAVASGFPLIPFSIYGFAPHRAKDRFGWLATLVRVPHSFSFFDSPVRIRETLEMAGQLLGVRPILVAREVTKAHQEFIRGHVDSIAGRLTSLKGEFTIVVGPSITEEKSRTDISDADVAREFGDLTENVGGERRALISKLAKKYRRTTRDIYAAIERAKSSVE